MTDAGWHPDPHGRADRRYHDGTRWTEHTADADGATSIDPAGPDPLPAPGAPAPGPVIGPPPPRAVAPTAAPPGAPSPDATVPSLVAHRADPPPEDDRPTQGPGTEPLSPDDVAAATASPAGSAPSTDHTVQMSAADVAAAAALAESRRPAGSTVHTEPIPPEAVVAAAAAAPAATGEPGPPPPGAALATAAGTASPPARRSPLGLAGALVGIVVGLVGLLALPWTTNDGGDESYRDLRELVDISGLPIGTLASAFVLTGALFAVGVGGTVALARALGGRSLRALAAIVVVLGAAGLAVAGFVAIDVDVASLAIEAETGLGPDAGAPVTLPDGTPVTDPTTGDAVTVPEDGAGTAALTDDQLAAATMERGEDDLAEAAVVGAVLLTVAAVLLLVGLAVRGTAGHMVTGVGLLVVAGWAIGAVVQVRSRALTDPGLGFHLTAAGAVLLAVSAAIPGHRRRGSAGEPVTGSVDGPEPEPTVVL